MVRKLAITAALTGALIAEELAYGDLGLAQLSPDLRHQTSGCEVAGVGQGIARVTPAAPISCARSQDSSPEAGMVWL